MDFDAYLKAINAHDWDAIVQFMTDDVAYEVVTRGERRQGKSDVRESFSRSTREFSSDFQVEPVRRFATDTDYASEWILKGTHDASNAQLPATGKQFAIHGASLGRLERGLIKEQRDYWNEAEFLGQVGLMPAPGAA